MKKKLATLLKYIFFTGLAALFVWLSIKDLNAEKWEQLKDALGRADYLLLIPVLLLMILSHYIRALRWRLLIQPLGYTPSRINVFLGVMIGYFVNLGAPRLGEVLKCTVLAKYEKVPADKLVGTIVAERAFDLICLLLLFGLAFIIEFNVISAMTVTKILPAFMNEEGSVSYGRIGMITGGLLLVFLLVAFVFMRFGHISIIQKIRLFLKGIWQGVLSIRKVKQKGLFLVQTALIWFLYLASTWLGFHAIAATSGLGIGQAVTVLAMGSVGMIVSPGGIGAYAYLIQQTVAYYNIPETPYGLALGWLLWFGQFVIFILCGVISFILLPIINKQKANEKSREHPTEAIHAS